MYTDAVNGSFGKSERCKLTIFGSEIEKLNHTYIQRAPRPNYRYEVTEVGIQVAVQGVSRHFRSMMLFPERRRGEQMGTKNF